MNLNAVYKMIVNAVPVNLPYVMDESVLEALRNSSSKIRSAKIKKQ